MKTVPRIQRKPNGHWVGDSFPVRSIFSHQDNPALRRGTTSTRGIETVTIVHPGEVTHRDNLGTVGNIGHKNLVFSTLGERHLFWSLVSSRSERIEQAKADRQAGRFAVPPVDRDEVIPPCPVERPLQVKRLN